MELNLETEFGERLTTLRDGRQGLRSGLVCDVREVGRVTPCAPEHGSQRTASPALDEPVLDFIASDESVDRYNEVIQTAGWQLDNYRKNPVVVDSHNYDSVARILGRSTEVSITNQRLTNRVKFSTDNPLGAMAYKMARAGFIKSESVGFIPLEFTRGDESKGEPYRTYQKQELIEISLVAVPANPGATMSLALKSGAIQKSDLTALADALKQFCSNEAETSPDSGARGIGFDGAQLRQLAEQLLTPVRAVLRRA